MKSKSMFLSAIIIAFCAVSCDNSEETVIPEPTVIEGEKATLSLQISGTPQTKAQGNPEQEDKVLKLDAFVFNMDGTIESQKSATSQNNTITKVDNIAVTSGTKKIFVLANYTGDVSSVKTYSELQQVVSDLKNEKDNGRLTMSTEVVDVIIIPGKNYLGYTTNLRMVSL